MKRIRCAHCDKKLAETLDGAVEILCPRCHLKQRFDSKPDLPMSLEATCEHGRPVDSYCAACDR